MNIEAELLEDLQNARTSEHFNAYLKSAYAAGYSLQAIGDVIGVTREAVRLRLRKDVPASLLKTYAPAPLSPSRQQQVYRRVRNKRLLGVKVSSPVFSVPVEKLNRLAELREMTTKVRGFTPLLDPARRAIPEFGELLESIYANYSIPQGHLETVMGLSRSTLTAWRRSHGYLEQMPSQKVYRGVFLDRTAARGPREFVLKVGGKCRNGHVLTERDIVRNGPRYKTCRICRKERAALKYQESKAVKS